MLTVKDYFIGHVKHALAHKVLYTAKKSSGKGGNVPLEK